MATFHAECPTSLKPRKGMVLGLVRFTSEEHSQQERFPEIRQARLHQADLLLH